MKSIRLLAIGTMLILALATPAQQSAAGPVGTDEQEDGPRGAQDEVPTVEKQLKVLTEKLDLTGDQQVKIRPILQELHDATQKVVQDDNMSREERLSKVRPERYKADKKIREILSDDQKKKLDEYLHGPHGEMHGSLSGATPSASAQDSEPKIEQQLKVLTEKLDLSSDQQTKIKPILQEMRDATQKFIQDHNMTREERLDHVRPWRERADKQIREILSNDQKEKLDQFERGPHPEMHSNLSGATPTPTRAP